MRYSFYDILDNFIKNESLLDINSKYSSQVQIFDDQVQQKLEKLNVFMIGAGALGCILLKYLAMMCVSIQKDFLL